MTGWAEPGGDGQAVFLVLGRKKNTLPTDIHFNISFPTELALSLMKELKPVHKWRRSSA